MFFNTRILGKHRRELLTAELTTAATDAVTDAVTDRDNHLATLHRTLADIDTRRARLLRQLELTDDPHGELSAHVRQRLGELRTAHDTTTQQLHDLHHAPAPTSTPALLDALPLAPLDLATLPEHHARAIFETRQPHHSQQPGTINRPRPSRSHLFCAPNLSQCEPSSLLEGPVVAVASTHAKLRWKGYFHR